MTNEREPEDLGGDVKTGNEPAGQVADVPETDPAAETASGIEPQEDQP